MAEYQTVFKRYEKKYLMNRNTYAALRERLEGLIQEDRYGLHTICNIYFDTDCYDLIRTSLDKPVYKEKLRLRSYGIPGDEDTVFLEIKKKFDGVVYKRRISMKLCEARDYLAGKAAPGGKDEQILREIDWFRSYYQPVPKVYLAYDRVACFGTEDPELRITFDQNIRYRTDALDLAAGDRGDLIIEPGEVLMELKIAGSMPLWLSHILNELAIYPASFSKYGVCYSHYLMYEDMPECVPTPEAWYTEAAGMDCAKPIAAGGALFGSCSGNQDPYHITTGGIHCA